MKPRQVDAGRDVRRDDVVGYEEFGRGEYRIPPVNTQIHADHMHQLGEHTELQIIDAIPRADGRVHTQRAHIDTSDRRLGPKVFMIDGEGRKINETETETGKKDGMIKIVKKGAAAEETGTDKVQPKTISRIHLESNDVSIDIGDISAVAVNGYDETAGRGRTVAVVRPVAAEGDMADIPSGMYKTTVYDMDDAAMFDAVVLFTQCFAYNGGEFFVGQEVSE